MTATAPLIPLADILVGAFVAVIVATLVAGLAARRGFPLPPPSGRLGCVDGLRGYLAFAVFIHHFSIWMNVFTLGAPWKVPPSSVLESFGSGSVALFFATTGLVFYPRVLSGLTHTDWVRVYISRLFRILPLTLFSITLVIGFILLNGLASADLGSHALARWIVGYSEPPLLGFRYSYRVNAFVLWSLWYEWIFYVLLLPLLALAMQISGLRRRGWSGLVPALFLAIALVLQRRYLIGRLSLFMPMFAVGMIAYEVRNHEGVQRWLAKPLAGVVAVACLVLALSVGSRGPAIVPTSLYGLFFVTIACGNSLFGLLQTTGARVLGECSFSIYLMHGLLLACFFISGGAGTRHIPYEALPAMLVPLAVLLVGITLTTFLLIERSCVQYGANFARWLHGRSGRLTQPEREVAP